MKTDIMPLGIMKTGVGVKTKLRFPVGYWRGLIRSGMRQIYFLSVFVICLLFSQTVVAVWWQDPLAQLYSEFDYQEANREVDLHRLIEDSASKHRLPASFIASIASIESNFDTCAVSSKYAEGIMQLITKTALSVGVHDSFDPVQGIRGGSTYLAKAYRDTRNYYLSAAYYNAGPKVLKLRFAQWPKETQKYVAKLDRVWKKYQGDNWKKYVPRYVKKTSHRICKSRA